jgi:hypothetical protein
MTSTPLSNLPTHHAHYSMRLGSGCVRGNGVAIFDTTEEEVLVPRTDSGELVCEVMLRVRKFTMYLQ